MEIVCLSGEIVTCVDSMRELEVAAVDVVGAQLLEVGIELAARVAVGLAVPGEPAAAGEFEQVQQRRLGKRRGADDANVRDARGVAFGHREGDVDAVALDRGDRGHDLGAVEAAAEVLALDFLLGAVDQRAIEGQALADAGIAQRLGQRLLVELLQADEADGGDDRPLLDDHDRDAAFDFQPHVLEQTGAEQRAQCGRALVVGIGVADAEGQRGKHRARIGALQTLDANVLDEEGLDGSRRRR